MDYERLTGIQVKFFKLPRATLPWESPQPPVGQAQVPAEPCGTATLGKTNLQLSPKNPSEAPVA